MDEIQAAVLDVKLRHLEEANAVRREIASIYINKVNNPLIHIPRCDRDSVWHIFPILSPQRDTLRQYLLDHGVETQIHYPIPPHRQQCYPQWHHLSLPITERIHSQELSLPCNQTMTASEADQISTLLNDV
jgi:dTDP-4-amino-4,6-dideoxygalactose transaminase